MEQLPSPNRGSGLYEENFYSNSLGGWSDASLRGSVTFPTLTGFVLIFAFLQVMLPHLREVVLVLQVGSQSQIRSPTPLLGLFRLES